MNITSGNCKLIFDEQGKLTALGDAERGRYAGLVPFKVCVVGEGEGQFSELTEANDLLSERFEYLGCERKGKCVVFSYRHAELNLRAEVEITALGEGVFRMCSRIRNEGERECEINRFSAAFITGFGGMISRKTPAHRVHYFESAWHAEARLRRKTLCELGLTYVSPHFMSKSFTLLSQGEYSTAKYLPAMFLEDARAHDTVFMSAECEGGWRMQLGHAAAYEMQRQGWYIEYCPVSASDIGRSLLLEAGQEYETPAVLFGRVKGGVDETVRALTAARRVLYKREEAPLMFNDYMNCLWSDVTEEKICKLAECAAALGAEGYCIDCGWFNPLTDMYGRLGDWEANDERFPEKGFAGTIGYIRNLGLIAGVWTELEICSDNARAFSMPDEWFICRDGKRVGNSERYFFDMRNATVRQYLTEKVRALYETGIRYIKNDFNAALRWSTEASVIADNHRAAMEFYAELKETFPDLYLENCGSGAMRSDYGTLKHFCIQSVSDQELYRLYPPLVQGTLANILPEQAGIWAYPYPNLFDVRADAAALDAECARQEDGRQTVFNMVSAMAGNLYLSGRIDRADEKNASLIAEGIEVFKGMRAFKRGASAVYPNGFADIHKPYEFVTLGLLGEDGAKMYLFFWKGESKKSVFEVPLKKWNKGTIHCRRVYPCEEVDAVAELFDDRLLVRAERPWSAAVFEIDFGEE